MSKVGELSLADLKARLRGDGLILVVGPFLVKIHSAMNLIAQGIHLLYEHHSVLEHAPFCDFHMRFVSSSGYRRWHKPKMRFYFGSQEPFLPLPAHQAMPLFEWAMNWCMANHSHQYLVIHAASLEKNGQGLVMPAPPGSGKSTLSAGLVSRGWRLLSDELAMIDVKKGHLVGLARPISLKGASLQVIKKFEPQSIFSKEVMTDTKGLVGHLKPSLQSVSRVNEKVMPSLIVFPKWANATQATLTPRPKGKTFLEISENSFNYATLGSDGFQTMAKMLRGCLCYDFHYADLDQAVAVFETLSAQEKPLDRGQVECFSAEGRA